MKYQEKLENILESYLGSLSYLGELQIALEYMLVGQGKRVRPLLFLALADDTDKLTEDAYFVALSLEFLHTSTLVHDDLPALDNDDFRRDKPSCHRKFKESTAILAGDVMMSLANTLILKTNYSPEIINLLIKELNQTYQLICYGQVMDLNTDRLADNLLINKYKTSTLFECVFKFINILTDKNSKGQHSELRVMLGSKIGDYFQLANDYLDIFAHPGEVGRVRSSDVENNKNTIVANLTQQEALGKLNDAYKEVTALLDQLKNSSVSYNNLEEVVKVIKNKAESANLLK